MCDMYDLYNTYDLYDLYETVPAHMSAGDGICMTQALAQLIITTNAS